MPHMIFADQVSGIILKHARKKRMRVHKRNGQWKDEPFNASGGEQALWRAVITQAVMDATNHSRRHSYFEAKKEAIKWLTQSSYDFLDVCLRAGLDPNYVRVQAKKAVVQPQLWRTDAMLSERYEDRRIKRCLREYERDRITKELRAAKKTGCVIFNLFS